STKEDSVQKQTADLIIQNVHIVTFDDSDEIIADGAIAVVDGAIAAIGPTGTVTAEWDTESRIFANGKIAMPGLIDAHVHTAQTLMRGLLTSLSRHGNL